MNVVGNSANLRPGLDVDFLVLEQGGHSIAADVSPRGVAAAYEEGTKQMVRTSTLKLGCGLLAALIALVLCIALIVRAETNNGFKNALVEWKVDVAFNKIQDISFLDMVPDSVVRQAVLDRSGGTYGARKAVWDKFLCGPVWNQKHDDMLDKRHNSKCFDALYSSGYKGPDNVWYRDAGLPLSIAPVIEKMRKAALEKARAYLQDPKRLEAFWASRKDVVLGAFAELSLEDRTLRIEELQSAKRTIKIFVDSENVRNVYRTYLQAERTWLSAFDSRDPSAEGAYKTLKQAGKELLRTVPADNSALNMTLFVGRRYSEGGEELLLAYGRIIDDFLSSVPLN